LFIPVELIDRNNHFAEKASMFVPSPTFVGRSSELSQLDASYRLASAGQWCSVFITGEAGGGKTRLLRQFIGTVDAGGVQILQGGCIEMLESGLPYAPFTAMLQKLFDTKGIATIRELVGVEGLRTLAWLLPECGDVAGQANNAGEARARLFEVIRRLCQGLATQGPLVLVIEDMHWSDQASIDLLHFLAERLSASPVMLIASYRQDSPDRDNNWRMTVAHMLRSHNAQLLTLPRLTKDEVAVQLEGILGTVPHPAVVDRIYQRGEGVPLFTEALADVETHTRQALPAPLNELLLKAVRALPPDSRHVINAAALGGTEIEHALLAKVVACTDQELVDRLRPAISNGLLLSLSTGYAFRHALVQEAAKRDLMAGERIALHRAFARTLEQNLTPARRLWKAVALARHWHGAQEAAPTLKAAWRAARDAQAAFAYAEQLQMLELVIDAWPNTVDPETMIGVDRAHVLECAADAACWAAQAGKGLAFVEQALAELDEQSAPERVAAMLLQRAMMRQHGLIAGEVKDLLAPPPTVFLSLFPNLPNSPLRWAVKSTALKRWSPPAIRYAMHRVNAAQCSLPRSNAPGTPALAGWRSWRARDC
jgi:predicted ATPase